MASRSSAVTVNVVVLSIPKMNQTFLVSRECVLPCEETRELRDFLCHCKHSSSGTLAGDNSALLDRHDTLPLLAKEPCRQGEEVGSDTAVNTGTQEEAYKCIDGDLPVLQMVPGCYTLNVDERLLWAMLLELGKSHGYRKLAFAVVQAKVTDSLIARSQYHQRNSLTVLRIDVKVEPWVPIMDKSWEDKIGHLVAEHAEVENAMAWLSTLGGAYSALGDSNTKFAEAARHISLQQLRLALRIGDPLTVCRCHIYIAMSLLQRGHFSSCKKIIRRQYRFAKSPTGWQEPRLAKMCQSVWVRMQYLWSLQKSSEDGCSSVRDGHSVAGYLDANECRT